MKEELELFTRDYPEANKFLTANRTAYTLRFPLADGRELVLRMGEEGFENITNMMMDMLAGRPSHSDGKPIG